MSISTVPEVFREYVGRTNRLLENAIEQLGEKTKLRDAIEYALNSGGKRYRPMIVMMIADALHSSHNIDPIALAVEYFHTASLIADDLPCMDNDDLRRSKPSLHKAFGEASAVLASYTLISLGYEKLSENAQKLTEQGVTEERANKMCRTCLDVVTHCAGIFGATSGQFFDLYPPDQSLKTIEKTIYQKTVTLFEIAFVCGWVFAGGDLSKTDELKQIAYYFGMAFQIADDYRDLVQDADQTYESNYAYLLGKEKALQTFHSYTNEIERGLQKLNIWSEPLQKLVSSLKGLIEVDAV